MDLLEILGYIGAIAIGLTLGLIGGGGSILTVPVLVYLLGISPILATAYSLFIVGVSSLFGGYKYARNGLVDFKIGFLFSIPALVAVYLTRRLLVPAIPEQIFTWSNLALTKNTAVLLLFAVLMLVASFSMIKDRASTTAESKFAPSPLISALIVILEGLVVGILTGLVGAGGGFLIIPALVLLAKLPMKTAVGTSLFIIAIKSLLGFVGDIQAGAMIDWSFLSIITGLSLLGILFGTLLSNKVDGTQLKKGFGYFVLIMGSFMIVKELFL